MNGAFFVPCADMQPSGQWHGACEPCLEDHRKEVLAMLWTIIVLLLVLWLLGGFVLNLGGLVHLLLVIALIVLLVQLISGRRVAL